jgi:hypothetical protein
LAIFTLAALITTIIAAIAARRAALTIAIITLSTAIVAWAVIARLLLARLATLRFIRALDCGLIIVLITTICDHLIIIFTHILIAVIALPVIALAAGFLLTCAHFGDDSEIMIGKLQIIFSDDPITLHLGVTRECLVFFEHLRRITARAVVDTVALFLSASAISLRALACPAATTTGLTIVKQRHFPHSWGCCVVPFISAAASPLQGNTLMPCCSSAKIIAIKHDFDTLWGLDINRSDIPQWNRRLIS